MMKQSEFSSSYLNKNQIYFVVYEDNDGVLQLAQVPLMSGLEYEDRLKLVKSIDNNISASGFHKIYHHYYNP